MNMIEISVIIINFNSSNYTIQCIDSIFKKTGKDIAFEIIVVDNKSETKDFEILKNYCVSLNHDKLHLYQNSENSGFGGGNMFGFEKAKGSYLAFVNNDILFKNDCLSILSNSLKQNHEIGVCAPTTYTSDGEILPTLDFYTSPLKVICGRKIYKYLRPKEFINRNLKLEKPTKGDFVSGSFMMLTYENFKKSGGFDTNIFLYHEETDLCKRLEKMNLSAVCEPKAECIHFHGASTPKSIKIKAELKRSLLYVIKKHYGNLYYFLIHFYILNSYLLKVIVKPKYFYLIKQLLRPISLNSSTKTD
ncbi:glycosyltransferase [Psychroflexus sp. CAK1W]|uniref:glycosyltransferase n=1 Tax=Psychroflexus curvus TaxID=2873595 RepID=UPI001CCDBECA|nr:glycosyltransferase [Psychroflexus curvus]MBZ9628409.1 glycosyltransferase [Psychroflexus curvus]